MATYGVPDWRKLGAVVRDARRRQGLTQADLAERAGVSRAWLAKLEAGGHRRAEMEQIFRLLSALSLEMVVREQRHSAGESAVLAALARAGKSAVSSTSTAASRTQPTEAQQRAKIDQTRARSSTRAQIAATRRAAADRAGATAAHPLEGPGEDSP